MPTGHSSYIMKKFFSSLGNAMLTAKERKIKLREEIAHRLSELTKEEKDGQSEIVVRKILGLPEFQKSQRVSIFLSTENEINTKPIIERIFLDEKQCFIPRYSKAGMEMVKLHSMEDWDNLPLTRWKIKQPKLIEQRENALETGGLDLLIVPGVAFTTNGHRLGHGGGYYDRYIKNLRSKQKKTVITVGVAFKEQVVDNIPTDEHDEVIDKIVFVD
ncbi:5-formyltetrahydrofolate cyclo-ligase [Coccinella septempunctata]|uniref:5-formyltetrahydrofolate cyclo-ligase n=1 Tax=Coccinella septempunctata TaxID=41139 RepID=UPI001D0839AA|nr:5-formyltetrahydrofolate cyclo-ligase [Coccinella septempunctata]